MIGSLTNYKACQKELEIVRAQKDKITSLYRKSLEDFKLYKQLHGEHVVGNSGALMRVRLGVRVRIWMRVGDQGGPISWHFFFVIGMYAPLVI